MSTAKWMLFVDVAKKDEISRKACSLVSARGRMTSKTYSQLEGKLTEG